MRRRFLGSLVAAAVVLSGVIASSASAQAPERGRSTYIVVFKNGVDPQAEANTLRGQGFSVRNTYEHVFPGVAIDLPEAAARGLAKNPNVQLIEPDGVVTASATQNSATWGLDRSDQRARPLNGTFSYPDSAGLGVRAYIIDTGIRSTHTEFTGRVERGVTAISDGRGTEDCSGHGTHVAGTVAGTTYGIAKKATLVPIRVLNCKGSGTWSGVIAGLDWVAANAVKPAVANMSLGGAASSSVDTAVANLSASGVTVVVAAGNDNTNACNSSPARVAVAVTVGSTTNTDARSSFSNFGSCVDIFAPGSSITSAWYSSNTATNTISGTSMATPHVAGAAALILGSNGDLSPAGVWSALLADATTGVVTSTGTGSPNRLLYVPSAPPMSITTASVPEADLNTSYSAPMAQSGAVGTPTWSATGLPTGLGINATTGEISGTPSVVGRSTVTVTVTTATQTASKQFTLDVVSPVTVTATGGTALPDATQYVAYSADLTPPLSVSGGLGTSYTWSVLSGMPAGLALNGSSISGTPTVFGDFTISLRVTSGSESADTSVTLTILETTVPPPSAFTKSSPLNGTTSVSRYPTLRWTASSNVVSYEICLATSTAWPTCTWRNVGNVTSYTWPTRLSGLTTYRWDVRAKNSIGVTTLSTGGYWSFRTRS